MKYKIIFFNIFILLFSSNVFGLCATEGQLIFQCITKKGKQIEVCDSKKTIEYSFGQLDTKPEIVIKVPRGQVSTSQWQGTGRWHFYTVDIPNGNTTYNVFWGYDALAPNSPVEAGVNVLNNDRVITTVLCMTKGVIQKFEGINLRLIE